LGFSGETGLDPDSSPHPNSFFILYFERKLKMTKQLNLFPQTNTADNCEKLANTIVDSMSMDELRQFVFDDVYNIMLEDNEVYQANLEHYGE
jgi:hypothetical protein